jgi:hypothetical protein
VTILNHHCPYAGFTIPCTNPTTQFAEFSGPAAIGADVGITVGEENALSSQRLVLGALSSDTSTFDLIESGD